METIPPGPPVPVVTAYGATAALVEVVAATDAVALAAWLRPRVSSLGALDVVPGARTVLVDGVPAAAVREVLAGLASSPGDARALAGPPASVSLPVVFDGRDLADVAGHWGVSVTAAVERLTSLELVSAFCGFAPGFAYLAGLPAEWSVPRLETPRRRVEPGSVALAGPWCGIYPSASPGGWRIVGRTEAVLWDTGRPSPALLAPGTRVRFRELA